MDIKEHRRKVQETLGRVLDTDPEATRYEIEMLQRRLDRLTDATLADPPASDEEWDWLDRVAVALRRLLEHGYRVERTKRHPQLVAELKEALKSEEPAPAAP